MVVVVDGGRGEGDDGSDQQGRLGWEVDRCQNKRARDFALLSPAVRSTSLVSI
jgi:hypothetical protein